MIPNEERFATRIRDAGARISDAYQAQSRAEAVLKRTIARKMVESGEKSAAAQSRYADEDDEVFQVRLDLGVADGELAAAKAELKACEVAFDTWRTRMATMRLERKAYGA